MIDIYQPRITERTVNGSLSVKIPLTLTLSISDGPEAHSHDFHNWDEIADFINSLRFEAQNVFGPEPPR